MARVSFDRDQRASNTNMLEQVGRIAKDKYGRVPAFDGRPSDGVWAEMVYQPEEGQTGFAVWNGISVRYEPSLPLADDRRLVPYSPQNNLITNEVVLLPSEATEYESEDALLADIRAFIHRYVEVSPLFETIASYYVLFTWVYDGFNELPYLRVRGDPGSGKTRFLLTVGSLCYRPIFASGASTVSPLFRILDAVRGTLVLDESDFRLSDERAEIVKILNNGNARGFPVLRSEATAAREYNPRAYAVFGPKLVATRGFFEDRALESRFLTEEMAYWQLRPDVPINLPNRARLEARQLRNKLLLFRFRRHGRQQPVDELVDPTIEPRLNQILVPLLSVVHDAKARADIRLLARRMQQQIVADRGLDTEAQVLEVIRELGAGDDKLSIKAITDRFLQRYGLEYDHRVTTKWIGGLIRRRLLLKTHKSHGNFMIPVSESPKLKQLFQRYGLAESSSTALSPADAT